jgi:hypothetical protein
MSKDREKRRGNKRARVLKSTGSKVGILISVITILYVSNAMHGLDVWQSSRVHTYMYLPVAVRAVIGGQDSPGERDVHEDVYEDTVLRCSQYRWGLWPGVGPLGRQSDQ